MQHKPQFTEANAMAAALCDWCSQMAPISQLGQKWWQLWGECDAGHQKAVVVIVRSYVYREHPQLPGNTKLCSNSGMTVPCLKLRTYIKPKCEGFTTALI
jgi:hypothetical protein